MKKIVLVICIAIVFFNILSVHATHLKNSDDTLDNILLSEDVDPLVDLNITIDILAIRALDTIDLLSDPDFFVVASIDNEQFTSPVWNNQYYLYNCWSISKNIDDAKEFVDISLQLWDSNIFRNKLCDIGDDSNNNGNGFDVHLIYDLKTGHWYGGDYYIGDPSGYGRVCGTSDGSIYKDENDCELWFNIYQNDFDDDGLPYWMEVHEYGTDPMVDNTGEDLDGDKVPIEWEHRWGFNPHVWEDHDHFDPDEDSLTNTEEFLVRDFGSDPFRKDLFLEMDFMQDKNSTGKIEVGNETFELMKNPFHRRNIVFHFDTGDIEGGEMIPFDETTENEDLLQIYNEFFLHNDNSNWRRGVFHYGIVVYYRYPCMAFSGDVAPYWGYFPGTNSFVLARSNADTIEKRVFWKSREYIWASNFVHELGHNFGLKWGRPLGCDCQFGKYPWQFNYWFFGTYKSVMNYRYTFSILDYSDGSHGRRDFDDWENIDLSYFEIPNQML